MKGSVIVLYVRLQGLILWRLIKELGVVMTFVTGCLLGLLLLVVSQLPPYAGAGVCTVLLVVIHLNRGDRTFLQSLSGRGYRWLYLTDYFLLSMPFVILSLLNGYFQEMVLYGAAIGLIPMIPKVNLQLPFPTHPLLMKGGYEYQNSFRLSVIFYFALLTVSLFGLCYGNLRIAEVSLTLFILIFGFLLAQPVRSSYLYNYHSVRYLFWMKIRLSLLNSIVLLGPFLLLMLIGDFSGRMVVVCILVFLATVVYFIQIEFLRFIWGRNGLLMGFMVLALFVTGALTVALPVLLIAQSGIALILFPKVRENVNGKICGWK